MDVLEDKIKEAKRFRDSYYYNFPQSTPEEKSQAVRAVVLPLIQDIPLDINGQCSASANYNYLCGRILNICEEYDANCERYLLRAVKLEPSMADAWHELGECVWKKKDFKTATDCYKKSLSYTRSAKCLASLALALRYCAIQEKNVESQMKLHEEALQLCTEAVERNPNDENAWQILGNSYLAQFFFKQQRDREPMGKAREAYERALQLTDKHCNACLHYNYSTVLKFNQEYRECLNHLMFATLCDPRFSPAKEELEAIVSYLHRINLQVQRKGKLSSKKVQQFQNAICNNDYGIYLKQRVRDKNGQEKMLKAVSLQDLKEGVNDGVVICTRIIAVIPNHETVPYTFVGIDKEKTCCAFAVLNSSNLFGVVIGDSITVPEPHVIDVTIPAEECKGENINFRIVRVTNPLFLLKNSKLLDIKCVAMCSMSTNFIS
ncbi:unnamed protein product [Thelazia callipaeda]|uniref:Cell division cycle protein 27 homolog n=1 Tax=Thelazia callipaeda TaxID=103827 RepID=A0A0N5CRV4_THECL|nr:unnamed protein product [Thelazia callipaeda]